MEDMVEKPRVRFSDDDEEKALSLVESLVESRPTSSRSTDSTTLREEERMLVHLKKENFDLKMKIFYLTERLKSEILAQEGRGEDDDADDCCDNSHCILRNSLVVQ